ncbi:MAG TPA: bifunctional precorrin-2 dehydrogenase/sirohydrochlorin ferrochelatase [Candidatus Omnitrophica bacterium]|nr:bifunctional precorrin-2 dehydrogenase/sirohydrochlorin ferrochelatase [Candidatus Omnitrophota bacterium]
MPKYYPVNLNLENKKCLVVGGGVVAERKVKRLLECHAKVLVVSPKVTLTLRYLIKNRKILYRQSHINLRDINKAFVVISATGDRRINHLVSLYCRKHGILVNVVDSPDECNFVLPSILRRGNLCLAVSTDGISPALAKQIRLKLEKEIGTEYAKFLKIMSVYRAKVTARVCDLKKRKKIFQKLINSFALAQIRRGKLSLAKKTLISILKKEHIL